MQSAAGIFNQRDLRKLVVFAHGGLKYLLERGVDRTNYWHLQDNAVAEAQQCPT